MAEMLVLADDFTGALDTGVQFARQNISTLVSTKIETLDQESKWDSSVLVLDLETRHLTPAQSAARVRRAVGRARRIGIEYFYKKTDSTLRGNIGSELEALLKASGDSALSFIPAYPANGRTTRGGSQYVAGVPLHLSAYAADPQNPVRSSYVPQIIAEQSSIPTEVVGTPPDFKRLNSGAATDRILVFDAQNEQDLRLIAELLKRRGLLRVSAGCAGFAAHLAPVIGFKTRTVQSIRPHPRLLFVCGSSNPVSLEQVEWAVERGMERIVLDPAQVLTRAVRNAESTRWGSLLTRILALVSSGNDLILQTARGDEDIRRFHDYAGSIGVQEVDLPRLTAQGLSELTAAALGSHAEVTPVVFGGDTALALVQRLGSPDVLPVEQILHGVVVSRLKGDCPEIPLISKAGGFGSAGIIGDIQGYVR